MQSAFELRLGPKHLAELERAFDVCASRGDFTAEHVVRECDANTRELLEVKTNRNAVGMLFKRKSATRRFKIVDVVPASHGKARGRLIHVWRKVAA